MESIQEAYDFVKRAEVLIDELISEAGLTADELAVFVSYKTSLHAVASVFNACLIMFKRQ